jgi:hypothetical protein
MNARRMCSSRLAAIAFATISAIVAGCTAALSDPLGVSGTYSLVEVTGLGPATGTLVLTRQGYAERRVRFRKPDSTLSRENLARGTAEFQTDGTVSLTLREIDPPSEIPWTPDARLIPNGVQIMYFDLDGLAVVEMYRRQ